MSNTEKKLAYHLLWVWAQYGGGIFELNSGIVARAILPHMDMSIGEDAAEMLEGLGLVEMRAWSSVVTQSGIDLMNRGVEE